MLSRRSLLVGSAAAATAAAMQGYAATGGESLARTAARRNILFGTATSNFQLADSDFVPLLVSDAGILVAEYEMKRKALEPTQGVLDFSAADRLVNFAIAHGMQMRGHTLCWHAAYPLWLEQSLATSRDEKLLTRYIEKVVSHFKGRVGSWDVVNEALLVESPRADGMRPSPWLTALGTRYVDVAFQAARAADPDALLVYNDWGCEASANDRFRSTTLKFLEGLLARGVPVGALGIQGHVAAFGKPIDPKKLRAFVREVKQLGLSFLVTEHDVDDEGGPDDWTLRDRAVAEASARFLEPLVAEGPLAILTWGLTDRFLDPPPWRERLAGRLPRKLPYDDGLHRKPMWWAMESAFAKS